MQIQEEFQLCCVRFYMTKIPHWGGCDPLKTGFQEKVILPPRDIWPCLETLPALTPEEGVAAGIGWVEVRGALKPQQGAARSRDEEFLPTMPVQLRSRNLALKPKSDHAISHSSLSTGFYFI